MADVTTTFGAKDVGFNSTVNRMQKTLAGFQSNLGGFATRLAGLAAAFVGVQQSVAAFNNALAMGGRLDDLSKTTGASAGELLLLEKAFSLAGSSAEAVGPAIARLNRFMVEASSGGASQVETMDKLGLSYAQLSKLTPTEQMRLLAKSIMSLPTPAQRTAAAMDIFGRSGSTLIPLFANFSGELDKAQGYLGSLPGLMDQSAAAMADMEDDLGAVGDKFGQFVAGLVAGAAGADNFASALAKIDTAGIGANLGESLRVAFDAPLQTSKAIGYTLLTGAKEAGNALINASVFAAESYQKTISSEDYVKGLGLRLRGTLELAANGFLRVIQEGAERLYKIFATLPGPFGAAARRDLEDIAAWQESLNSKIAEANKKLSKGANLIRGSVRDAVNSTEILSKDWLNVEQSAADAARHLIDAKKESAQIREDSEKVASNFGEGSAALTNALKEIRGFDLSPKEGPENRPDWMKSSEPAQTSRGKGKGGGGGGKESSVTPEMTRNERIAEMQGRRRSSANDERADRLEARGFFRAADSARRKAERQRNDAMTRGRLKDLYETGYGARNFGEAYENYRQQTPLKGRLTEEQFDAMNKGLVKDKLKTPEQRAAEEEAMRQKQGGGGGKSSMETDIHNIWEKIKAHLPEIDKKLPQTALVYS